MINEFYQNQTTSFSVLSLPCSQLKTKKKCTFIINNSFNIILFCSVVSVFLVPLHFYDLFLLHTKKKLSTRLNRVFVLYERTLRGEKYKNKIRKRIISHSYSESTRFEIITNSHYPLKRLKHM